MSVKVSTMPLFSSSKVTTKKVMRMFVLSMSTSKILVLVRRMFNALLVVTVHDLARKSSNANLDSSALGNELR